MAVAAWIIVNNTTILILYSPQYYFIIPSETVTLYTTVPSDSPSLLQAELETRAELLTPCENGGG